MTELLDVVIVGGGPAGMSAALVLGRSLRRTLVLDHGAPRNSAAGHAHNLFTRDGTAPEALQLIARRQLAAYPGALVRDAQVTTIHREGDLFVATDTEGDAHRARRVLLASGVVDELPPYEGFERFWGTSAFHCPYCHGWEARGRCVAILGDRSAEEAMSAVEQMRGWTHDLVLCTDGGVELDEGARATLALLGVELRESPIESLEGGDALECIRFADGTRVDCGALFLHPRQHVRGPLVESLGCRLCDNGLVEVGPDSQTSVPGIYAAGDMTSTLQQVVTAAASGTAAAISLNRGLLAEDLAHALAHAPTVSSAQ